MSSITKTQPKLAFTLFPDHMKFSSSKAILDECGILDGMNTEQANYIVKGRMKNLFNSQPRVPMRTRTIPTSSLTSI